MAWYKIFESLELAKQKIPDEKLQKIKIKGRMLLLTRMKEKFFVVDDECPHQGASLSEGSVSIRKEVICPWHGYSFSLVDGTETSGHSCPAIKTYETKSDDNGFFIKVDI